MTAIDYPIHIEIKPRIHLIRGENRSRFPSSNSILVDDEILTLIDAGAPLSHIETTLRDLGHVLKDIDRIILTHFHFDHKGNANRIWDVAKCEVLAHPSGESGIRSYAGFIENYGLQGHRYWTDWEQFFRSHIPHILEDYEVTGHFHDGQSISCGEVELIPIHAPGHSKDHTCFGLNGFDTIFLVDIDLTKFGPWYGTAVSDIDDFEKSIQRIIDLEPQTGISSHLLDPVSDSLIPRLRNYLATFDARDQRIIEEVQNGVDSIERLAQSNIIYPRFPHNLYVMFEELMIRMHVDRLVKRGVLVWNGDRIEVLDK